MSEGSSYFAALEVHSRSECLWVRHLQQVDLVLSAESFDQLDVLLLTASFDQDAEMGLSSIQSLCTFSETSSKTIMNECLLQHLSLFNSIQFPVL